MKYRIKNQKPPSDTACMLFLPVLLSEIFKPTKPYIIQYKKWWWLFWKNHKRLALGIMWDDTYDNYEDAIEQLNKLKNHEVE